MRLTIKPADGLKVPDPFSGGYLPEEGREVEDAPYWRRLLKYKNVIPAKAAAKTKASESQEGKAAAEPKPRQKGKK